MRLLSHRIWWRKKAASYRGDGLGIDLVFFFALIFFVTIALLISRAAAAVHPVPLDKNVDAAKCLECHEDKSKGKFVHSAIATGCLSCHEVRVNKDITRIKLITSTPQALCITCHADKDAAALKGTVHPPAVRDCIKCHDPHSSDNRNQLLKAASGEKGKNLCLDCHTQGLNVPEKGSRHAALDAGCDTCHVTHKVGEEGKQEFDNHLTKAVPALCIDCHNVKEAALIKAHQGQPFATATCTQCHDPHQSTQPKLLQKFTHPPFADKTCEICHEPAKDGKVVLTNASTRALCATCHSDQVEKIDKAKVPDLGPVLSAGELIAGGLRAGQLVILQSTTFPGTTMGPFRTALERSGLVAGRDFDLAFAPERVHPGDPTSAGYASARTPAPSTVTMSSAAPAHSRRNAVTVPLRHRITTAD